MRFDARSKLLFVIAVSLSYGMVLDHGERVYVLVVLSVLSLLTRHFRLAFVTLFGYLGFFYLSELAFLPEVLSRLAFLASRIWAPLMAGHFLFLTTSSYELIVALRKCHFPESLVLTMGVLLRFLPLVKEDAKHLKEALWVRGLFVDKWSLMRHPYRYLELFFLPLMASCLRRANELSIASLSRGLSLSKKKTAVFSTPWTYLDWSLCLWSLTFLLYKLLLS